MSALKPTLQSSFLSIRATKDLARNAVWGLTSRGWVPSWEPSCGANCRPRLRTTALSIISHITWHCYCRDAWPGLEFPFGENQPLSAGPKDLGQKRASPLGSQASALGLSFTPILTDPTVGNGTATLMADSTVCAYHVPALAQVTHIPRLISSSGQG